MSNYIVLTDRSRNWRRSQDPAQDRIAPARRNEPCQPKIETGQFSPADLRDFARDPDLLAVAAVISTHVIAPAPLDDIRAEDVAPDWGLTAIGAKQTRLSGKGTTLAVLDTGIDTTHPAFAGVTINARDFAGTGIKDANGHGTHFTGTVLGRDVGARRIGVAPGITDLIVAKALADNGHGTSDAFLNAFLWAVAQGANIITFALRFDTTNYAEDLLARGFPKSLADTHAIQAYRGNLRIFEAILRMISGPAAPLVLGAVGNDSLRMISPDFETGPSAPAAAHRVLGVGALAPSDTGLAAADFSNLGPMISAPGVGICSAEPGGGLRCLNGSSMALAHATGVAALWRERMGQIGPTPQASQLADKMFATATNTGLRADQSLFDVGHGLVQAP